jgi:hypothetical protein
MFALILSGYRDQNQHNALQIDDTRSYWRLLTLVPGGSGNDLENLP